MAQITTLPDAVAERDNDFYKFWDKLSRDRDEFRAWMEENALDGSVLNT